MRIDSGVPPFRFQRPYGPIQGISSTQHKTRSCAFLTPSYRLLPAMAARSVPVSTRRCCAFKGLKLGLECGMVTPKPAAPAWLRFDEHASLDKNLGTAAQITLVIQEFFRIP